MQPFIPKNKADDDALEVLKNTPWEIIRPHAGELLTWLQDMNWPIAGDVADVLAPHTNELRDELIEIFRSNDSIWKYYCLRSLNYYSKENSIDVVLLAEIKRLAEYPTDGDRSEEVDEIAKEILKEFS